MRPSHRLGFKEAVLAWGLPFGFGFVIWELIDQALNGRIAWLTLPFEFVTGLISGVLASYLWFWFMTAIFGPRHSDFK